MLGDFVNECIMRYGPHTGKMVEAMIRLFRQDPDTDIDIYANDDDTTRIRVGAPTSMLRHPENTQVLNLQLANSLGPDWLYNALVTVREQIIKEEQKSYLLRSRPIVRSLEPHEFRVKPAYVTVTLPDGKPGRMEFKPTPELTPYEFHCCTQMMAGLVEGNQLAYATAMGILHHFEVTEVEIPTDRFIPPYRTELPYGSKYYVRSEDLVAYVDKQTKMLMPTAIPSKEMLDRWKDGLPWLEDKTPEKK